MDLSSRAGGQEFKGSKKEGPGRFVVSFLAVVLTLLGIELTEFNWYVNKIWYVKTTVEGELWW